MKFKVRSQLNRIEAKLGLLIERVEQFMATVSQDLKDLSKKFDDATNAVAARIDTLVAGLKNSMTDQELADAKAGFQAEIDRLTVLGQNPNNPVPPTP